MWREVRLVATRECATLRPSCCPEGRIVYWLRLGLRRQPGIKVLYPTGGHPPKGRMRDGERLQDSIRIFFAFGVELGTSWGVGERPRARRFGGGRGEGECDAAAVPSAPCCVVRPALGAAPLSSSQRGRGREREGERERERVCVCVSVSRASKRCIQRSPAISVSRPLALLCVCVSLSLYVCVIYLSSKPRRSASRSLTRNCISSTCQASQSL